MHDIFDKQGCVDDDFISKKIRKFIKEAFGFVRFRRTLQDAINAIRELNGLPVRGLRLRISMARYNKGGTSLKLKNTTKEVPYYGNRWIKNTSFREKKIF